MPNIGWEMANPITVATAQAISEMIRTRRSSSRCSMTVIRRSSSGGTTVGLAMTGASGAVGLGRLGVGRRLYVGGRPVWRRMGLCRRLRRGAAALDFIREVCGGLAELTHRLPDRAADLRKLPWPVDDQDDREDDDEHVPVTKKWHSDSLCGPIIRPLRNHFLKAG